jgi:hypothetical protein
MAKRTRYPARPAARRPGANRIAKPSAPRSPVDDRATLQGDDAPARVIPTAAPELARTTGLTEGEIQRAAELEAEETARERAAIAASVRRRTRGHLGSDAATDDINAPLSVRASHEYAYVARDVRRIVITGALMVAILAVLDVLVNVLGVLTL